MHTLPYADEIQIEYIPFGTLDGQRAGTYDDLVYQIYFQVNLETKCDAFVFFTQSIAS